MILFDLAGEGTPLLLGQLDQGHEVWFLKN